MLYNQNRFQYYNVPFAFSECLTNEMQIMWLYTNLAKIEEEMSKISSEAIQIMIDENNEKIKEYIDNQDEKIYNKIEDIIVNLKNYTDEEISKTYNEIILYINERLNFLRNYIDLQDTIILNKLEQEISRLEKEINDIIDLNILVYNPTQGIKTSVQKAINDIYSFLRYYGIECNNFDALGLTVEEFENYSLTASEFDLYSKCKLEPDTKHSMFSPFDGIFKPITEVINDLANLHKSFITAEEFDSLDLSAEEFDNKNLTAYQFDWEGKILLTS